MLAKYKKYILARYDEEYKAEIKSNFNEKSGFYIIKLGETTDGESIVPYDYNKHYYMMDDNYKFNLYAVMNNDVMTELFTGTPIAINKDQAFNFKNIGLEELEELPKNYFYVLNTEEISKETMAKELYNLKENNMIRYYNDLFSMEMTKQNKEINNSIENKKKEKYIEEHADEIIGGFVKKK